MDSKAEDGLAHLPKHATWLRATLSGVLLFASGADHAERGASTALSVSVRVVRTSEGPGQLTTVKNSSENRARPQTPRLPTPAPGSLRLVTGNEVKEAASR